MKTFALDKNYDQINFEVVSVAELEVISGGSGGAGASWPTGTGPTYPGPSFPTFPGPAIPSGPTFPDSPNYSGSGSWG